MDNQPVEKPRWYGVQVASNCESKVKTTLEKRAEVLHVNNRIHEIIIPTQPKAVATKGGKRKHVQEKVFPGYILIHMVLDDETAMAVRTTPNVLNFVGVEQQRLSKDKHGHVVPKPLSQKEVRKFLEQQKANEQVIISQLEPGDLVTVLTGPFATFTGEVISVSEDRTKVKALVEMFGRTTSVELAAYDVEARN